MTAKNSESLYLDDLGTGQVFESDSPRVEPDEMLEFARSFDSQPFHLDPQAAESSIFGALADGTPRS